MKHAKDIILAGFMTAAVSIATPMLAAEHEARLSLDVPEGHPKYLAAEQFAAAVATATDGEVEIKVFGNSLLGGEAESAEGMRLGSVQGGIITSSVFATWVPEVQVLDLPFLFADDAHAIGANAVLTERLGPAFDAQGFHLLGFSINGARQLMSTFPIQTPEDVRGKKMRVIQNPIHIALWQAVGANPVPIPAPEVYNSMQTGVVDFFDNTATNYLTLRFYEVAPHYTKLDHVYAMGAWVLSKSFWDELPPEYQEAVNAAAMQAQTDLGPLQRTREAESLDKAVEEGATIHEVADKAPWRAMMEPVWAQFTPNIPGADDTIAAINAIQ